MGQQVSDTELIKWFHYGFREVRYVGTLQYPDPPTRNDECLKACKAGADHYNDYPGPKCFLKDEVILKLCKQ